MRFSLILLFLVTLLPYLASSQKHAKKNPRHCSVTERKLLARQQIINLKNGTLLLRLKTRKPTIDALIKQRKDHEAVQLEYRVKQEHEEIMNAFSLYFNFCKTAFFYSESSPLVTAHKFDQVMFIGVPDSGIIQSIDYFMIAEFGNVMQDTMKHFSQYSLERNSDHSLERVRNYHGGPDMGMSALVVMSDRFIQLRAPFPYYVKFCKALPYKRAVKKAVKKLNRRLHKYYREQAADISP